MEGRESAPLNLRLWFSARRGWIAPYRLGESLPQVEEFKYLGLLFMNEGDHRRGDGQMDRSSVGSDEERAEPEGKALNLQVNNPHLWS